MLRHVALLAVLSFPMFAACSGGDDDDMSAGGGSGGSGGSKGCATGGKGTIVVEVIGLPSGVDADIGVENPEDATTVTESTTLEDVPGGTITFRTQRVTDDDPIVRTVYDPVSVEPATFCLKDTGSQTVTVTYRAIPTSNKLWTTNANGDHALAAFESAALGASGDPDATVTADGPAGNDVAFDVDGNLWSIGGTVADAHLLRFPADQLGGSGTKVPDRNVNIQDLACIPAIRALAFDRLGNLWVSACGDEIVRVDAADLERDGDVTPGATLSGVTENGNLAFDRAGNLWVVSDGAIARFDSSRLDADDSDPADLLLTVLDPDSANPLSAQDLAFDADGNLWATDFGGNLVFEVDADSLDLTGDSEGIAAHRITIGVTSLIDRPAFDEGGGLWIGLGANGVGRLSPAELAVDTMAGDPTNPDVVITSADFGSVGRVGFYPAPADLPLFHAVP